MFLKRKINDNDTLDAKKIKINKIILENSNNKREYNNLKLYSTGQTR